MLILCRFLMEVLPYHMIRVSYLLSCGNKCYHCIYSAQYFFSFLYSFCNVTFSWLILYHLFESNAKNIKLPWWIPTTTNNNFWLAIFLLHFICISCLSYFCFGHMFLTFEAFLWLYPFRNQSFTKYELLKTRGVNGLLSSQMKLYPY